LLWTCTGRSQNIVLMLAQVGHPQDMDTGGHPDCDVCVAVDVHYLGTGGVRAAAVLAADATFACVQAERAAVVTWVPSYRPGEFYLRELPPLRAVLDDLSGLGLLVVDGYADLDPGGRPGLGAHAHAEFGIPVIGVAKSRFLRQPAQPPRRQHRGDRPPRRARLHPHHRNRLPPRTTPRHHHRRRDHGPALQRKLDPAPAGNHELAQTSPRSLVT
jgi:deoxyribonuclease V